MMNERFKALAAQQGLVGPNFYITQQELERFAALVAAKEREECAKVVEIFDRTFQTGGGIASSIRARGNE